MPGSHDIAALFRLYLITDDVARPPQELARIVRAAIAGGVTAVQLREKRNAPGSRLQEGYERLAGVCSGLQVPLLINADLVGRIELVRAFAGFHFGIRTRPIDNTLTFPLHAEWLIAAGIPVGIGTSGVIAGYSAHTPAEAAEALDREASFVTVSPVYATQSKPELLPAGLEIVRETRASRPDACIVGLGGIDSGNAAEVIRAGADGVAVISAIMAAADPEAAARELRGEVEAALRTRDTVTEAG